MLSNYYSQCYLTIIANVSNYSQCYLITSQCYPIIIANVIFYSQCYPITNNNMAQYYPINTHVCINMTYPYGYVYSSLSSKRSRVTYNTVLIQAL